MNSLTGRLKREHATLKCMAKIYCAHHHLPYEGRLCVSCDDLMSYAGKRLEKCPYGDKKPACSNCAIHCYKKLQRQQVRTVMRFAGPRMTYKHPWRSLIHFYDRTRQAQHPKELRLAKKNRNSTVN